MINTYNQYHTDLKLTFTLGLYQEEDIQHIPKSTLHNWKRNKSEYYKSFLGNHFSQELKSVIEKLIKAKTVINTLKAYLKMKHCLLFIARLPKSLKNTIETKEKIVKVIQNTRETLGFNRVLKYFDISASTYHDWAFQIQFSCEASPEKLCFRRFVNQISIPEIKKLKSLMESIKENNWPLSSIWGYGKKHKIISFSKSTFYKYARILFPGYPQKYKKKRSLGFVTYFPNQVWHCDITQFKMRDGKKANIYILMDNFSKFILNWKVSLTVSSSICKDMIQEAIDIYSNHFSKITLPDLFPLINLNLDKNTPFVHLLSDGGPENLACPVTTETKER
jgi:ACT domain-containing protein